MYIDSGENSLIMSHSSTLTFWVYLTEDSTTGTLFSKILPELDSNQEIFKVSLIAGSWKLSFSERKAVGDLQAYSIDMSSTTAKSWWVISVILEATGGHESDLKIYKNTDLDATSTVLE